MKGPLKKFLIHLLYIYTFWATSSLKIPYRDCTDFALDTLSPLSGSILIPYVVWEQVKGEEEEENTLEVKETKVKGKR